MTRADFIVRALLEARAAQAAGAPIIPEVAVAQAALESGYGQSRLAVECNNLFGIKSGSYWQGPVKEYPTSEWRKGQYVVVTARWRVYPDWKACFASYGAIIEGTRWYADAAKAAKAGDPIGFLDGLLARPGIEPGWATEPAYKERVLGVMRSWPELAKVLPRE